MKALSAGACFACLFTVGCDVAHPPAPHALFGDAGLAGDRFTVDGEPFLVVGIGYDIHARPGAAPWIDRFNPDLFRKDLERIVAAGFNTIRTWNPLTDEQLAIAAEHGLWVLQGVWFDPAGDFADPTFRRASCDLVEREIARSAPHPNVLGYLVMNEPHADAVHRAGTAALAAFCRELAEAAKRGDPRRPVSFSNCVMADWLPTEAWDFAAYNVYPYAPVTIEKVLGYRGYLESLKASRAADKPLLVTEFGLSVSPQGDGRGYGGNTLEQQRDGDLRLWHDVIQSGAAGGCVFMWTDGWWKHGDEKTHDPHAEEWYGLLEVDSGEEGTPRPAYVALKDYNRAIRTQPRDGACHTGAIPVEVWSPRAERVDYRLDGGTWRSLAREGRWWWRDAAEDAAPAGATTVETRAFVDGAWAEQPFAARVRRVEDVPVAIRFADLPASFASGRAIEVGVQVARAGVPLAGRPVRLGRFVHTAWNEFMAEAATDASGRAIFVLPAPQGAGVLSLAASVDDETSPTGRAGAYAHVDVSP